VLDVAGENLDQLVNRHKVPARLLNAAADRVRCTPEPLEIKPHAGGVTANHEALAGVTAGDLGELGAAVPVFG